MTQQRTFKRRVRERMAKTGERYTAARRQLLAQAGARSSGAGRATGERGGDGNRTDFVHLPGIDPETTGLRVLLANRGVTMPHSGEIPSEALLLGIAGGIGAGVFAFRYDTVSSLFLAGRHLWQDGHAFVTGACERLGIPFEVHETGGARTAVRQLEEALAHPPVLAWLDVTRLPYRGNSGDGDESSYHAVTLYAFADGEALLGDLAPEPVRVAADDLARARARVKKFRHRLLTVGAPAAPIDSAAAIRAGLRACVDGFDSASVGSYRSNFRLDGFSQLADRMHAGGKHGWRTVFPRGRRLWSALISLYRRIEHEGSGGGLLRPLYADFLSEAAPLLGDERLRAAAEHYRTLGAHWTELAHAALPDEVAPLAEARALIDGIDELLFEQGGAHTEVRNHRERLDRLAGEAENEFPLDETATDALLAELAERMRDIHRLETDGLALLREITAN